MGFLSKAAGHADVNEDVEYVRQYFSEGEEVIQSFHFFRNELIHTNFAIYFMDVQGLTGNFQCFLETAGRLDFDVDIKIGLKHGYLSNNNIIKAFHFKVPKAQTEEAKQL